jgi:exoribonuclease-2
MSLTTCCPTLADPTRWVRPGEALDLEGRRRTRTLYLPWGALPMFPRALAEGPFSLNAGAEPCEALSISAVLAPDGSVAEYKVQPSSVLVTHKLTYDQVDDMLAQPAHCPHEQLLLLQRAAELRTSWRKARDSVDILLPEADVEVAAGDMDSALPRVTITSRQDGPARRLVQEMMVLAGGGRGWGCWVVMMWACCWCVRMGMLPQCDLTQVQRVITAHIGKHQAAAA